MKAGSGCGVYREPITRPASPMPAYPSMADQQRDPEERAMRAITGLLKYFPETGWMSVYLRREGYFAYVDRFGKYTARAAKSLRDLPAVALRGPLAEKKPWSDTASARRRGVAA